MKPLPDEDLPRRGPPLGEKLVVGCGLFVVLVAVFVVAMSVAFKRTHIHATQAAHKPGDVVHVPGNLDLTLLRYYFSRGTSISRPRPHFVFLVAEFKLHNPGAKPRPVFPFQAVSGVHIVPPEQGLRAIGNPLSLRPVAAGGNVAGTLVFDIEEHARVAEIAYHMGNFQAAWQFHR